MAAIRLLVVIAFWTLNVLWGALIGFPVTFITRDITFLWNIAMIVAKSGIWIGGIRVRAVGREALKSDETYVYMSNHVSNLDPPIIVPLLNRQISILAKRELFRIPVLGTALRIGRIVPVDRSNREAAIESVRQAIRLLQSGRSMLVFPEGTRSRDGRLLPFKKGPFHMVEEAGVKIAPMTIVGTHEAWPKGKFALYPREITVVFHPPIDPKQFDSRESLMEAVRATIDSALPDGYRAGGGKQGGVASRDVNSSGF